MEEKLFRFLPRGRFLLWAMFLTAVDLILTYVGIVCGKVYEASPFVSFITAQWGLESGFTFLMFSVASLSLFMTMRWGNTWVKAAGFGLLMIKVGVFFYHLVVLHAASLI